MTFTPEQSAELAKPLNSAHVKPPAPGKFGDYIEGWKVIEEANRIFGFDGWTRETVSMIETNREKMTLPGRNNSTYEQWRVGFVAKVRVTVHGVVREGTGFGSGMSKPEALGDAIESAVKEAETDAMKRALMTFGNPFGLALYDKTQANVVDEPAPSRPSKPVEAPKPEPSPEEQQQIAQIAANIDFALEQSGPNLAKVWKENWSTIQALPKEMEEALTKKKDSLKAKLPK